MKLIIDIDEKDYNDICNSETASKYSVLYALDGIRNGKPLPKGHGDLIDANKMIKELNERIRIFDEGRNEIRKQLDRPEENNQIPLWLWKGCCKTCGIVIEADKEE